jgi:hypothetical protein
MLCIFTNIDILMVVFTSYIDDIIYILDRKIDESNHLGIEW